MASSERQDDQNALTGVEPPEIVEPPGDDAVSPIGERNAETARLFLELAMDRARGVRDTADAINSKVSWVFAYLGVLLVAMAQGISGVVGHRGLEVLATLAVLFIAINAGTAVWALRMAPLRGLGGDWPTEMEARRSPADVAYDMAKRIVTEARKDSAKAKKDGSKPGAIAVMKRRLRYLQIATAVSTATVCIFFLVKIWST